MKHKSGISVTASPEDVFDLLERDRTQFVNDELSQRRAVGDLPFGPGYRFDETVLHAGETCSSTTRVTICDRPWVLHEEWRHHCRATGRTISGSQRFEITSDRTGTIIVCELVQRKPGLDGLVDGLIGSLCNPARRKVDRLAMRAEALALSRV